MPHSLHASRATRVALLLVAIAVLTRPLLLFAETSAVLASPSHTLTVTLHLDGEGALSYAVHRGRSPIILDSKLGLEPQPSAGLRLASSRRSTHSETWKPVYGERASIPDQYNQLNWSLTNQQGEALVLEVRAYDAGIAFRYGVPHGLAVTREQTEFHLPAGSFAYEEHGGTEGDYHRSPVGNIATHCQAPLTIALPDGTYAAILEAANNDFPLMTLASETGKQDTLIAELGGPGTLGKGSFTPWRLVMSGTTPGDLLEHNYLQLNLNEKQAIRDTSWIKPGTVMREVTLSDDGGHKTIDFAAAHHIPYILFDAGWYGSEDYDKGDATHERTQDAKGNPAPPLHLKEIVQYGKAHGVGVFLYIDRRQAMKQKQTLFPLFEQWGVVGVKIGFVAVGKQENTAWILATVRDAAAHHLMLDIHDQYRTTGYTRTYPNLLTVEGIQGNEHFPPPEHNATVSFTRYLAGSADYTICYYSPRLKNTHAHQLAMSVISYSPLQSIFWYDKPSDSHGEPEIRWFEGLPTVWDESRVLSGEIGNEAVLARRSGKDWYLGAIGDSQGQSFTLPLTFLAPGVSYNATLYTDDPTVDTVTHVAITHRSVTRADTLPLALLPRGGEAIYFSPAASAHR